VDEQAQRVVCKSSGKCTSGACGWTTVWQVVVGWTRLWRDCIGSRAACHKLVCDNSLMALSSKAKSTRYSGSVVLCMNLSKLDLSGGKHLLST
jgi:hypothetical protein